MPQGGSAHFAEKFREHAGPGLAFGEGFVAEADAVQDHVLGQGKKVFGHGIVAAVQKRPGPGRLGQGNAAARTAAEFETGVMARPMDQGQYVFLEGFADVDILNFFHDPDQIGRSAHWRVREDIEFRARHGMAVSVFFQSQGQIAPQDLLFLFERRIGQSVAEHGGSRRGASSLALS